MSCTEAPTKNVPGRNEEELHPPLKLETGVPDDYRKELLSGFELYGAFWTAWQEQDHWSPQTHAMFWRSMLPKWPLLEGRRPRREQTALAYRAAEQRDLDPAAVIDCKPDTLRKKEVKQEAALLRPTLERAAKEGLSLEAERCAVVDTDYMLPRVFTGDEPEPDKDAFRSVEVETQDEKAREIRGRLGIGPGAAPLSPEQQKLRQALQEMARDKTATFNQPWDEGKLDDLLKKLHRPAGVAGSS